MPANPDLIARFSTRIGGSKAKEVERFLKFAVVGITGTFVNALVLNALMFLFHVQQGDQGLPDVFEAVAYAIAIFNNFVWNRFWVYPDSRSKPVVKQLAMFYVVNSIGYLINMVIFSLSRGAFASLLANMLHQTSVTSDDIKLGANMGLLLATCIVMFWNFFVNRYLTYNDVK
ncbi:MAG TPA: GtrA family protein [Aggregatilineales bacterium]|nr:GtrA family protein [Aggregatilineales bacterium]